MDIALSSGATDLSSGVICYYDGGESATYAYDSVSWPQCRWGFQYYRGITFTSGTDVTNQSLITWLENNAVQVTIDTLSNTSWLINEVPESYAGSETYPDSPIGVSINFIIVSDPSVTYSNLTWWSGTILRYRIGPAADLNYLTAYDSGWVDSAYRTITIIDGSDVTSNFLRGWFQANAVPYVVEPDYVDKTVLLSGDEYYFKDTISGYLSSSDLVAGTNISIEEDSEGKAVISSSSSARVRIIRLPEPTISDLTGTTWLINSAPDVSSDWYVDTSFSYGAGGFSRITFTVQDRGIYYYTNTTADQAYLYGTGWANDSYRTITFNGNVTAGDKSNDEFIGWLLANATQVS